MNDNSFLFLTLSKFKEENIIKRLIAPNVFNSTFWYKNPSWFWNILNLTKQNRNKIQKIIILKEHLLI